MPMLAKIYIILSKCFPTLCTYSNNIKEIRVSSMFDYHKKKSPPILRLHCVCGGRSYGSSIFKSIPKILL